MCILTVVAVDIHKLLIQKHSPPSVHSFLSGAQSQPNFNDNNMRMKTVSLHKHLENITVYDTLLASN